MSDKKRSNTHTLERMNRILRQYSPGIKYFNCGVLLKEFRVQERGVSPEEFLKNSPNNCVVLIYKALNDVTQERVFSLSEASENKEAPTSITVQTALNRAAEGLINAYEEINSLKKALKSSQELCQIYQDNNDLILKSKGVDLEKCVQAIFGQSRSKVAQPNLEFSKQHDPSN